MKISILFFLLVMSFETYARNIGQTEITTEDGIEVFQNEKYYLLKKNVSIISDDFELSADIVRAYFEKDLYDIIKIESEGNATLKSTKGLFAKGEKINFLTKEENIIIIGKKSSLIYNELNMFSDDLIEVNNSTGKFHLEGKKSEIKNDDIEIYGSIIKGKYINIIEQISSVGELLHHIFTTLHWPITPEMATCLFAAIVFDTDRFLHSNVTTHTLQTAANLSKSINLQTFTKKNYLKL